MRNFTSALADTLLKIARVQSAIKKYFYKPIAEKTARKRDFLARGFNFCIFCFLGRGLLDLDDAVFLDGDFHAVFYVMEEFVAQAVNDGHGNAVHPNVCQDGSCGGKGVDVVGKQHTGGVFLHGAGAVKHQPAGGRSDGLGQAKSLPEQGFSVQILVALISAFYFLIAELQRHLEGSQRVEAFVRYLG